MRDNHTLPSARVAGEAVAAFKHKYSQASRQGIDH